MKDIEEGTRLLESKVRGKKWVEMAAPVLVGTAAEIKGMEKERGEETKPLQELIDGIRARFKAGIEMLGAMDSKLRERFLKEYPGTEAIKTEGGEIRFQQKWGWEVEDEGKVDRKYMVVDSKKVNEAIKGGVRNIKGISIGRKRVMVVMTSTEKEDQTDL